MGLTAQEIHIELDQAVQRLNSKFRDDIRPEEKDWLYNIARLRFIKRRLAPQSDPKKLGHQANMKRYEDLEELVRTDIKSLTSIFGDFTRYYLIYPPDVLHYLTSEVQVIRDCEGAASLTAGDSDEPKGVMFPLEPDNTSVYEGLVIRINGQIVFDIGNYPVFPANYFVADLKFYLISLIRDQLKQGYGYDSYWERIGGLYLPGKLIVITNNSFNASVALGGNPPTVYAGGTSFLSGKSYKTVSTTKWHWEKTRMYGTETADRIRGYSFGKTKWDSVVLSTESRAYIAHSDGKFILNALKFKYYRKPKRVDISLNVGCELSETTSYEVCDEAARMYVSRVTVDKQRLYATEQLLNE